MSVAAETIIAHLPLAKRTASRYARDDRHDDYAQEAALGLVQAARRFDPSVGVPFGFYARQWCVTRCQRYRRGDRTIPHPRCVAFVEEPGVTATTTPMEHEPAGEGDPETLLADAQERASQIASMALGMAKLTDRERSYVERSYLGGESGCEIARGEGVSATRVNQIIRRAIAKMRAAIT